MRAFGGTIRVHGIDTSNPRGEVGMEQVKRTGHVVNTETGKHEFFTTAEEFDAFVATQHYE